MEPLEKIIVRHREELKEMLEKIEKDVIVLRTAICRSFFDVKTKYRMFYIREKKGWKCV